RPIQRGATRGMRIGNQSFSGTTRKSPRIALSLFGTVIVGAYETAQFILAGELIGLAYIALAFICCILVIVILNNWRQGLYVFITWLMFEDLFRKFLGNNMAIYFAKDFLL